MYEYEYWNNILNQIKQFDLLVLLLLLVDDNNLSLLTY